MMRQVAMYVFLPVMAIPVDYWVSYIMCAYMHACDVMANIDSICA